MTTAPSLFAFAAGNEGTWRIRSMAPVIGDMLAPAERLSMAPASSAQIGDGCGGWRLQGLISNIRYATSSELTSLRRVQEPLGRPAARCAALIPIRKSAAWWALAQDERRAIFEETSHHTAVGLAYLPAVSRQLFHCRDLGEPFDFLTWFEYAPEDASAFEALVAKLRQTAEWTYVEREIDIRLDR